jgi:hypothetical protein
VGNHGHEEGCEVTDLTEIEKPLGLLSNAERQMLTSLPWRDIEVYGMSGWQTLMGPPIWVETVTYRAKRMPRRYWLVGDRVAYEPVEGAIEVIEVTK